MNRRYNVFNRVWYEVTIQFSRDEMQHLSVPNRSPFLCVEFLTGLFTFHLGQRMHMSRIGAIVSVIAAEAELLSISCADSIMIALS